MISDGAGGLILTGFRENRGNPPDMELRFQRITINGELPWGVNGVTPDTSQSYDPDCMISDGVGGVLFSTAKHFYVPDGPDESGLIVSRLNSEGDLIWSILVGRGRQRPHFGNLSLANRNNYFVSYKIDTVDRYRETIYLRCLTNDGNWAWDEPIALQPTLVDSGGFAGCYNSYMSVNYDSTVIPIWCITGRQEQGEQHIFRIQGQRVDLQGNQCWNEGQDVEMFNANGLANYLRAAIPSPGNGVIVAADWGISVGLQMLNYNGQLGVVLNNVDNPDLPTSKNNKHLTPPVIFPNPANNKLHIRFRNENLLPSKIRLFDFSGRSVYSQSHLSGTITTISLDNIPSGQYFINFGQSMLQPQSIII